MTAPETTPELVHPDAISTAAPTVPTSSTRRVVAQPANVFRIFRRGALWLVVAALVGYGAVAATPWVRRALNTVSTDDAYVNGHVTFVAPRVGGQVAKVFVDDNNRVRKGDLLVELDKEPYEVQVGIAKAAVGAAEADLAAAVAEVRGLQGKARSLRFGLQRTIEDVHNQVAVLRSKYATLKSQQATVAKAQSDFNRGKSLAESQAISTEEFDQRKESLLVAQAREDEALEGVRQVRVALGLPMQPKDGDELTTVPDDLDQTFSAVKVAQASLIETAAQIGIVTSFGKSPQDMLADFYQRDPQGDIDRIFAQLLKEAPSVKQAEAKLAQARRNLDEAELNLRYCEVRAEIDGVVTRRNVNPGNNIVVGQSLMAVRSLTEIWIDANFKETQLRDMRIGQAVDLEVDMYGGLKEFKGRISGFTMGTGSTLALLPAENATGNFVKVVQRLPVRIELTDYDPEQATLFVGLSVTPYVHIKETATGPNAGKLLQPNQSTTAQLASQEK